MAFDVALQALSSDAARWDDVSGVLQQAGNAAGALRIDESAFSFAGGEVASTYESVRSKVESLLRGGATETSGAADALLEVKRSYESTDGAARGALGGIWDRD